MFAISYTIQSKSGASVADQLKTVGQCHVWGSILLDLELGTEPSAELFRGLAGQFETIVSIRDADEIAAASKQSEDFGRLVDSATQWLNAGANRFVLDIRLLFAAAKTSGGSDCESYLDCTPDALAKCIETVFTAAKNIPPERCLLRCGDLKLDTIQAAARILNSRNLSPTWLYENELGEAEQKTVVGAGLKLWQHSAEAGQIAITDGVASLVSAANAGAVIPAPSPLLRPDDAWPVSLARVLYRSIVHKGTVNGDDGPFDFSSPANTPLVPTVVCDTQGIALGLAYSNLASLEQAFATQRGVYWSRSRNNLWIKGDTSGDIQHLDRIDLDCDRDTLRFCVRQEGEGFCHLGTRGCFGRYESNLQPLATTIEDRIRHAEPGSYTARLLGDAELLRSKLREEVDELFAASDSDSATWEAADVLYFALVMARQRGVELQSVIDELVRRDSKVTRRPGNAKPGY